VGRDGGHFLAGDGGGYGGRSDHALDEKGRLVIPARFRAGLGERFTLSAVFSDGCLALYSQEQWEAFRARLKGLPRSARRRQFERLLAEHTLEGVACDSQGRLLLAQAQRDFAQIGREVVMVKTDSYIEVWAKDRFEPAKLSVADGAEFSEENGLF
jgi:MraZ protein